LSQLTVHRSRQSDSAFHDYVLTKSARRSNPRNQKDRVNDQVRGIADEIEPVPASRRCLEGFDDDGQD
jgi:hypothetical protein